MKKVLIAGAVMLIIIGFSLAIFYPNFRSIATDDFPYEGDEPDVPAFLLNADKISKEEFIMRRAENIGLLRGIDKDKEQSFNPEDRIQAIQQAEKQRENLADEPFSEAQSSMLAAWTPIGPAPIPNGQTEQISTPVSGRVTAIAVHPTNANIVFVGTAQGGVYRTLNGGTSWTPLLDGALSLAIGAVTIAPSQPDTVYVGTGESTLSAGSYFGVGIYRIDNASSAPTITGPIGGAEFNGRAVSKIVVHPDVPGTIFASSTVACSGINCSAGNNPPTAASVRGLFRSTNATSQTPTFTKIIVGGEAPANFNVRDIVLDPLNPNFLVVYVVTNGGGIYITNNALAAVPTFTHPATGTFLGTSNNELNGELAIQHTAEQPNPTIYAAIGNFGGRILRSVDGGLTFTEQIDNNFCTPQCFYNIAVAVDPFDSERVFIGGAPDITFAFSNDGGSSFTESERGLHVDSHVITIAPSSPTTIYFGSDGGIYKSIDSGLNFMPLNNTSFSASQFISLDVHPTDANFTLGGTQDNGTNLCDSNGTWRRVNFGDGGYAVIDQNATDTTNVRMYHTYYTLANFAGYATAAIIGQASDNLWTFRGCNNSAGNGISCNNTALFYAPLERGPGSPVNSIYYGTDRLYRSADNGFTHSVVSQAPVVSGVPISAIGIAPSNDSVRIIGLKDGGLWGTSNGSATLTNLDTGNVIPNNYVSRAVIAPNAASTAYVTLAAFGINNIYKTTNLNSLMPVWTSAVGSGASTLPQVPVSSFLIDPLVPSNLYAGTDIGVFVSINGGASWAPFGTGLPRIAVFGLEMAPGSIIRAATHGKGMYQIPALLAPTAALTTVAGRVMMPKSGRGISPAQVTLTDMEGNERSVNVNKTGSFRFKEVETGNTYIVNAYAKNYTFASQSINVTEEVTDLIIAATP